MNFEVKFQEQNKLDADLNASDSFDVNLGNTIPSGPSGATYYPTVSDDGIISWTNNRGFLNPEPKDISGPPGPRGQDGTGVNILGSYDTVEQLEAAHPTGEIGDAYLVQGELYVWDANSQQWKNVGNIRGPAGPQGTQGEIGPQGIPGKSAYESAKEAGYEGSEKDFNTKLTQDITFETDNSLVVNEQGVLCVNVSHHPEPDNTQPITSGAVYTTVGNIEVLLGTI